MSSGNEIRTDAEVAHETRLTVRAVQRLARLGLLPGTKVGRRWRFVWSDVLVFLKDTRAPRNARRDRDGGE